MVIAALPWCRGDHQGHDLAGPLALSGGLHVLHTGTAQHVGPERLIWLVGAEQREFLSSGGLAEVGRVAFADLPAVRGRGLGIRDEALFLEVCLAFDCLEHNPVVGVASVVIREGLSSKAADALDVHQGAAQHSDGSHSRSVLHLADGTVGNGEPAIRWPGRHEVGFHRGFGHLGHGGLHRRSQHPDGSDESKSQGEGEGGGGGAPWVPGGILPCECAYGAERQPNDPADPWHSAARDRR